MIWLHNSRGRPDALLTFSAGAVAVVLLKVLAHGVVANGITFGSIDAGTIGALLTPTLGAYTAKRIMVDKGQAAQPGEVHPRGFVSSMVIWLEVALLVAIGWVAFWLFDRGAK